MWTCSFGFHQYMRIGFSMPVALLASPRLEGIDVAAPRDGQPGIILQAAKHKLVRGILAQKPLAMSVREATECVEACERAGIALAVNQNMRFDQSIRAMR